MEKRFVWAIRKKNWLFLPVVFLLAVMPLFMDYGGGYADFGAGILEKAFFWN